MKNFYSNGAGFIKFMPEPAHLLLKNAIIFSLAKGQYVVLNVAILLLKRQLRALLLVIICLSHVAGQTVPEGFSSVTFSGQWNAAVGFTFGKDGKQLFVWEKAGKVWVENSSGRQLLLDISEEVANFHDHGMLGFALHPQFELNGYFYVLYVVDRHHLLKYGTNSYNATANEYRNATIGRLTRYKAIQTGNGYSLDTASRKVLLGESTSTGIPILSITHGVGTLLFGSDGSLLVSCGEGSAPAGDRGGSDASGSYAGQGLADSIITPQEDVGSFRSQLLESLSGKILRLDPETGDGLPGNPFFDAANPRAARSRVYALGLRNPFRMTIKPNTGSHNSFDGNPGVLYVGDVGAAGWEELNIVSKGGMNFGWPLFEGLDQSSTAYFTSVNIENKHAPNPLYGVNGCTQAYFYFQDLLKQATASGQVSFANLCNPAQAMPATVTTFMHSRPVIDWRHFGGPARVGIFDGETASAVNIGAAGSPVSGPQFGGGASTGGVFYTGDDFPAQYKNTYFHGDYGEGWIRNIVVDSLDKPSAVRSFIDKGAIVVAMGTHPVEGGLYYLQYGTEVRKVYYSANRPPLAKATVDSSYGESPLTVHFTGSSSVDPEGEALTYEWNFGDGTTSTEADPTHTFTGEVAVAQSYQVSLTVTDSEGDTHQTSLTISINNTPPQVEIISPAEGTLYAMNGETTYALQASVTDTEHQPHELGYEWQTTLHHNEHMHPGPIDTNIETTTVTSPLGCDGEQYFYRITLKVTDLAGLSTTKEVRLYPDCNMQIEQVQNLAASAAGAQVSLSWNNPAGNFDEVMIVASEVSSLTVKPAGDGSSYVANNNFTSPAASAFNGGKVVYKGRQSPQTITGLTNNKLYFFSVFTRSGSAWSEGVEVTATPSCPAPTIQASNLSFSSVTGNAITLTWANGNGSNRIVKINTTHAFTDPADGTVPTASKVYIGAGEQVIANGAENTVTVTGLQPNTIYHFRVYEYNCTAAEAKYITSEAANNPLNAQTGKQMPVVTWANPAAIPYGIALSAGQLNATANVPGTFTYSPPLGTTLNPGPNQVLTVDFVPTDANTYNPVMGTKVLITVNKANQTINFATIPDKLVSNPPFTVNATSSSGLPVTFSIVSGPATISGNIVTLTGTGQVIVRASQAGNANFEAAAPVERTFNIVAPAKQNQSITFNSLPHKTYGDGPFTINARASSGLPVTFSVVSGPATIAGNTVTLTGAGTVIIQASQAGNNKYNAASLVNQSFIINKGAQTITMDALPNKTYGDGPFTINARASSGLPVTFSVVSGSATISDNIVTLTGAGTVIIQASQPGNTNFKAAYINKSFVVDNPPKQNQAISFAAIADKTYSDVPFIINATASSGLPVIFSVVSGPATISGNNVTLTGTGQVTIRAAQAGNHAYNATHVDIHFTVYPSEPVEQSIRFDPISDKTYGDAPFEINAAASSGLPVTFNVVSGPATIAGNIVTLTGAGTVIIRATQAGNTNFQAATPVERTFCVTPARPVITAGSTIICQDAGVLLSAPTGYSGYVWSNGETTQNITVSKPGNYTVKVIADGCESITSLPVAVTLNTPITANAGDDKTVYMGYIPAQCVNLGVSASGGLAPYTYLWSTGETTTTINACPVQTTTYTVTVTDSRGCSTTDEVAVQVIDVKCGSSEDKVQVCNQEKLLCINPDEVPAHLANGYELGTCLHDPNAKQPDEEKNKLALYPNPFYNQTSIEFMVEETAPATLEIYSANGTFLYRIFNEVANAQETYKVNFYGHHLTGGIYIVKLATKDKIQYKRVTVIK